MTGYRTYRAPTAVVALAALAALTSLTGCSDDDTPSSVASKAASVASRATDVYASATAAAGEKFDEVKSGVDVKDDVTLGAPDTGSDGRTTVEVTVRNTAGSQKSFLVQVNFKDGGGDLADAVAVTVSDVPAGGTKKATARSNRDLSGDGTTEVARAVRY
ncbi:hypothetical protein DI272_23650 [Streptomyces sp. Act143]|uniref:hypothetical protein n=1 Tax=Streptomyces sp. Act143 TaxID=2200760 RepID=UPI000D677395|nr:hypothetical protein [Streptomyces sp. Act143]PWI16825.1 hypothetical protein DI272_23650 [Streptomyces sp. Act143]